MTAGPRHILLISPTWLGDAIMCLPAFARKRADLPNARISVLTKPSLEAFWARMPGVDTVRVLAPGLRGTFAAARLPARERPDTAWIVPNAFRAAWIPWLGGIRVRRGFRGHWRRWLLTDCIAPPARQRHQAWEAFRLFDAHPVDPLPPPVFPIDPADLQAFDAELRTIGEAPLVGVLPGAARGASKRWPPDLLITALQQAQTQLPAIRFLLLGTVAEAALCAEVAAALGTAAFQCAGRTRLNELAALLWRCNAVLCNDSGGMHLAAAVGTRTVALFGATDPEVTGPLGSGHVILRPPGIRGQRKIARNSPAAHTALRAIQPQTVAAALIDVLTKAPAGAPEATPHAT